MTTAADWIHRVRAPLLAGYVPVRNRVGGSGYTAASNTITFADTMDGIDAGTMLSIANNVLYVRSATAVSLTAAVDGGQDGSTDVNANAGDLIRVNPQFSDWEIFNAINDELDALSAPDAGLFTIGTVDVSYADSTEGYDLTGATSGTLIDVYEVLWKDLGSAKAWRRLPKTDYRLDRNMVTTDFATGLGLRISANVQQTVRVLYRKTFTRFAATTDNVTTTGLPATAYDLPVLGAQIRLMQSREVKRNFTESQGEPRRAEEVPAGAVLRSWQGIKVQYDARVQAERNRLARAYPFRAI